MVVAESPMCLEGGDLHPGSHPYACSTETILIQAKTL